MNVIVIKGRLTADPELRKAGVNQTSVCNFSVAVNRRFEKDKTDFINCEAWGGTAEFISKYFVKGKEISLCGELHIDQYEKDGEKRYSTRIRVDNVEFCGGKNDNTTDSKLATQQTKSQDVEEIADDDLPF